MKKDESRTKELNLKQNVGSAIAAFIANAALASWSYSLVIDAGGLALIGLWAILQSWIQIVKVGDPGLGASAAKFLASLPDKTSIKAQRKIIDTLVVSSTLIYLALSAIGLLILTTLGDRILPQGTDATSVEQAEEVLPLLFVSFFLQGVTQPLMGSLQGLHSGYLAARLSVAGVVIQLLFAVWLIPGMELVGFAWAQIIQNGFLAIAAWILILRRTSSATSIFPSAMSYSQAKRLVSFSLKLQIINLSNGFFEPVSRLVIAKLGGLEASGLFELTYRLVQLPRGAVASGVLATLPAASNLHLYDTGAARELYRLTLRRVWVAAICMLVVVAIFAPLASLFWLEEVNISFLWMTAIIFPGIAANLLASPAYIVGIASGGLRYNFITSVLAMGTLLCLSPLMASFLPTYGATIATSASLFLAACYLKFVIEHKIVFRKVGTNE